MGESKERKSSRANAENTSIQPSRTAPGKRTRVQARYGSPLQKRGVIPEPHCDEATKPGCFLTPEERNRLLILVSGSIPLAMLDFYRACMKEKSRIEKAIKKDQGLSDLVFGILTGGIIPIAGGAKIPDFVKSLDDKYKQHEGLFGQILERSTVERNMRTLLGTLKGDSSGDIRNSTLGFIEYVESQVTSIGMRMLRLVQEGDDQVLLHFVVTFSESFYDPMMYDVAVRDLVNQFQTWIEPLESVDLPATAAENSGNTLKKTVVKRAAWLVGHNGNRRLAQVHQVSEDLKPLHQASRGIIAAGVAMQGKGSKELVDWVLGQDDELRFVGWIPDNFWQFVFEAPEILVENLKVGKEEAEKGL
jgi:hypothetical protein